MGKKINPSWEREKGQIHSPEGVKDLRRELKDALVRKYCGLAENMWKYNFEDFPQFEDMLLMTRDDQPEKTLMQNGIGVWFELNGQWQFLPCVMNSEINIYGNPVGWSPIPVGYVDGIDRGKSAVRDSIRDMKLDATNSVLMKDSLYGRSDYSVICKAVDALVDNYLTINQLTLLAKSPYVFRVGPDNILDAKNFFLAMCEDRPAIFVSSFGDKPQPVLESTQMKIDPALFEIFDRFECQILEYLGFPCVPITKRAQQTVSEVQSNDSKIYARRLEKWNQRQKACDRINELFGLNLRCVSVIDEDLAGSVDDSEGTEDDETQEEG